MSPRLAARWLLAGALAGAGPALARGVPDDVAAREALALSPVSESVAVRHVGGQAYLGADELARLFSARRAWHADVRRLTLSAGSHRVELTLDSPFAVIDRSIVRLPFPARSVGGEMLVPAAFVDTLPRDPALPRLLYDPLRDAVVVLPAGGVVRAFAFSADDSVTRLVFTADRADEAVLADRMRGHFRLRFTGYFAGGLPAVPPRLGLVLALLRIGTASGCAFELAVAPEAAGYRLVREAAGRRVTLEIARAAGEGFEAFAPELRALPPGTPTVVLDAGHGGADSGVEAGGLAEKRLTLELARLLREQLERGGIARVVLTRDEDRAIPAERRAETANRARADLFVSLHFDGFPAARARGVTVWCPPAHGPEPPPAEAPARGGSPATARSAREAQSGQAGPAAPGGARSRGTLVLRPWRESALPHAARSRAFAEAVRSAFELRDLGPVRVRELVTVPLAGVDAPCVMLECGTLTAPADAERLRDPAGLRATAGTLVSAIAAWRRSR
jgi:N-acetylmuramoyl-L-alanine amidase